MKLVGDRGLGTGGGGQGSERATALQPPQIRGSWVGGPALHRLSPPELHLGMRVHPWGPQAGLGETEEERTIGGFDLGLLTVCGGPSSP